MKRTIKFSEDMSIDQLLIDYEIELHNSVFNAIKENFKDTEKSEINVVNISMQTRNYTINVSREKFKRWLNQCKTFFEKREEYEKCQECVDMINNLKNNKKQKELIN